MATILYPTRGGDLAHLNRDWVIALAQERRADVVLLYVSNVRFLDRIAGPVPVNLIQEELDQLGEFVLAMAQERVEQAGLTVMAVVKRGAFRPALKEAVEEHGVTTVVLGRPAQDTAVTTIDYIDTVAQYLQGETEAEVYIVDQGKPVAHFPAAQRQPPPGP